MSEFTEFAEDSCRCGKRCAPGREVCETCFREGVETDEARAARVRADNLRAALRAHRHLRSKAEVERRHADVRYHNAQCRRLERELDIADRSVA